MLRIKTIWIKSFWSFFSFSLYRFAGGTVIFDLPYLFKVLAHLLCYLLMCVRTAGCVANSVDFDQTSHSAV